MKIIFQMFTFTSRLSFYKPREEIFYEEKNNKETNNGKSQTSSFFVIFIQLNMFLSFRIALW